MAAALSGEAHPFLNAAVNDDNQFGMYMGQKISSIRLAASMEKS